MLAYIVEDDENIREIESFSLEKNSFKVKGFSEGEPLLNECLKEKPDIVILDIMLPGKSGFEILEEIRNVKEFDDIPILMVSAKSSETDKVKGLDMGADDYITKPFGTREFVSRVNALLRRFKPEAGEMLTYKEIIMDNQKRSVKISDMQIELTFKEYELLKFFISKKGVAISRDTLLEKVWGYDFVGESRTVDMHINTLRKKLGTAGGYIKTVRNVGYILE